MRTPHSTAGGPVRGHPGAGHAPAVDEPADLVPADLGPVDLGSADLVRHLMALRDAVTSRASARRAERRPLEWVLAEMQGLVQRAERLEGSPDELGVLLGQVRLWTIAGYAEEPELRNVPRFY